MNYSNIVKGILATIGIWSCLWIMSFPYNWLRLAIVVSIMMCIIFIVTDAWKKDKE